MEKRFVLFLVLSALIVFTHLLIQSKFAPQRPADQPVAEDDRPENDPAKPADQPANGDPATTNTKPDEKTPATTGKKPIDPEISSAPPPEVPPRLVTLGSALPDSPFRLLVTFDNQGAAIERIEMTQRRQSGRFRYRDLDVRHGYLGHLSLQDEPGGAGCRVRVVGPGTPAALATSARGGVGLQPDDVLVAFNGQPVLNTISYEMLLRRTRPGDVVELEVRRRTGQSSVGHTYRVELTEQPMSLVRPESQLIDDRMQRDPLSFLLTLETIGGVGIERTAGEIRGLRSLWNNHWEIRELPGDLPAVEFRFRLRESDLAAIGATGALEIVKRYRLATTPDDELANDAFKSYHLELELEIHNLGTEPQAIAYRFDGPNGLPLEGWWYLNKIDPRMFHTAGARDIVWQTARVGHELQSCTDIYKDARKAIEKGVPPGISLFASGPESLEYIGVDTQYFNVVLLPEAVDERGNLTFLQAYARPAGTVRELKGLRVKTANTSFRLSSKPVIVPADPGQPLRQKFVVFAGPKHPQLLAEYGLSRTIEFGWPLFEMVARPLSGVLHFFESLPLINYGLAIILLTVLVRGGMFPLSRKATKNAQMMQQLAPEMKLIAEKYKNDMEKRSQAQRELFAKHNYNPFGGCALMLIQLPIFIGLYRALSVDTQLRQAALIPGLEWCSNLAGPDMLWFWKPFLPGFLVDEAGWLGPYLNILPVVTIGLFLVQQKMFMPPATDEQTRMQQQVMKFMMVFMGVLFFKVPSGLCVYFIASSLWGILERKLLPTPAKPGTTAAIAEPTKPRPSLIERLVGNKTDNGADNVAKAKAKAKRRQRRR